ncbi:4Fe-4S dicluster domain-containing protein [Mesoterricola silvestris]|uniref:Formate hydrogenlyase complex iron-sulfur subunit n=1 Tax=Mesoterricola silvestris TaxID=2927979 RepID=A0AA48KBS6_9BACT|nr:4Fe-4S dicluster domain-containing protein [Mesoterricola silvestris]BDU72803.1 formate hydrogenlyase complex iron-sulfur subunit [Mesoterricola silvestris]
MFHILRRLAGNLAQGPVSLRFPAEVPPPAGLRGLVRIDPGRCLACGICSYVCVSNAITGAESQGAYAWAYEPGRCTFCGRCEDHCPGSALSMDPQAPPSYTTPGELARTATVAFPACPVCGEPNPHVTEEWIGKAFGAPNGETRELLRLCVRCRRRRIAQGMKQPHGGQP